MKRSPSRAEIDAAELEFAQSSCDIGDGLRRVNGALHANLAKTSTIALIVGGVAGVFVLWRALRRKSEQGKEQGKEQPRFSSEALQAPPPSLAGIALAFLLRYGVQGYAFIRQQIEVAKQKRAQQVATDSYVPSSSATVRTPTHVPF